MTPTNTIVQLACASGQHAPGPHRLPFYILSTAQSYYEQWLAPHDSSKDVTSYNSTKQAARTFH